MGEPDEEGVIPDGIVPPYIQERIRARRKTLARCCPVCQAKPGEPCTQPTNTGRREIKGFHLARETDEEASTEETSEKGMK